MGKNTAHHPTGAKGCCFLIKEGKVYKPVTHRTHFAMSHDGFHEWVCLHFEVQNGRKCCCSLCTSRVLGGAVLIFDKKKSCHSRTPKQYKDFLHDNHSERPHCIALRGTYRSQRATVQYCTNRW